MSSPNFVLNNEHTFEWTVVVKVPHNSEVVEHHFTAEFKLVSDERRQEIGIEFFNDRKDWVSLDSKAKGEQARPEWASQEEALLNEVLLNFKGVMGADGEALPFNPDTKRMLIKNDYAMRAMVRGYMKALAGESETKNSSR